MVDSEWFSHEVQPYHQIKKGHSTSIECCSYHPNHEYEVFTGSDDKTIKCWDLFKFKCSNTFEGHT
jgi:WD40 repeat protein